MNLEPGMLLYSRYRIQEILGEGGMGAVYRAVDENLGVEVALKENFFTSDEYARQFHREAAILASLRHPNLPRVTDHFVIENEGQYLVMDFMEGEDLRERIDRVGILPEEEVLVIGVAICDALTYMHSRVPSVLHRDIKPGNVKVTPNGEVSLVDFGLAKIVEGDRETTPGARAMTPGYSPPEQYGTARTDSRTDVYSLGATLYEALTGAVPEDGLSRVMEQAELSAVRIRNPDISKSLAAVIEKALAVRPEDRYQTAEEFKQALLSASKASVRRRMAEGGLTISPPPDGDGTAQLDQDIFFPDQINAESLPNGHGLASGPMETAPEERVKLSRLILMMVLGLIVGVVSGMFFFFPDLSTQAVSMLVPSNAFRAVFGSPESPTALPTLPVISPTAVPGEFLLSATPTPSLEPSQIPSPTDAPTETPIPRSVLNPPRTNTPSPTPTSTPLGGGVGQIAFASDRTGIPQIWVKNVDGSGLRQVTDMQAGACQPEWDPGGGQFVFISPCDQNRELYQNSSLFLINADGTNLRPLPTILGGDYDPAWSPDGRFIAFTSLRIDNRPQIYILEVDTEEVVALSEDIAHDFQPSWAPDSSRLIFVTTRRGPFQIWVRELSGELDQLFSRSGGFKNTYPRWSPNGLVIVFNQSKEDGGVPTLVGVRFENETYNEFRLFHNWIPSRDAKFSPDGFWLAFESWPDGDNHEIFIMTPNGVDLQQLTFHPATDFDPAWRPVNGDDEP